MLCENCHTTLPDEALACWKCGTQITATVTKAPTRKAGPDLLLAILTFVFSAVFFVCVGWSVPFTVWGLIVGSAKQFPQLSGVIDIISGISFIVATLVFIGGAWWGAYWFLKHVVVAPSGGR